MKVIEKTDKYIIYDLGEWGQVKVMSLPDGAKYDLQREYGPLAYFPTPEE